MGRVKLKIKRLESTSNRQVTYSKRRNGILKKAKELSILCDIDIILLMFSPTGKPTLFHGERSNIEEVIAKFAQLTPQERAKRKLESLEALKKTFKKLDHDVNIQDFIGSNPTVEELTNEVLVLQAQLNDVHKRLSYWCNPDKIDNIEHLSQMEELLRDSIERIHLHEENFGKHQLVSLECTGQDNVGKLQFMSLECTNQFQSGMPLPFVVGGLQEAQTLSWLPKIDNRQLMLPNDPSFQPHRDPECSDAPLLSYSGFMSSCKQSEIGNTGQQGDSMGQENGSLNELGGSAFGGFQLGEQYSYPLYGTLNVHDDKKVKPDMDVNLQVNPLVYQDKSNLELHKSIYGNGHQTWIPSPGSCGIPVVDDKSYHQQPNQLS